MSLLLEQASKPASNRQQSCKLSRQLRNAYLEEPLSPKREIINYKFEKSVVLEVFSRQKWGEKKKRKKKKAARFIHVVSIV
jgi:hypothetical protein